MKSSVTFFDDYSCHLLDAVSFFLFIFILFFAQKANIMANSPASCQIFCKETPRSLEQQLQEHR